MTDQDRRILLNRMLEELLGSNNVYFQPPSNARMQYPCIVYEREDLSIKHANNVPYNVSTSYSVTLIDPNPDSSVVGKIAALPKCSFRRHFTTSGLNHDVFILHF